MSVKNKTYWEVCIEINPICADILCDIIMSGFDCEGIITAEEKYKNLELTETTENMLKAYIVADSLDIKELNAFFQSKRQDIIEKNIFNEDIGSWNVTLNKQEIVDWSKKWKEKWKPSKISEHIVICPTWEKYIANEGEIIVKLDPGNAFGTGTHATTQLCIKSAEKYMKKDSCIADIGCGSGILAICALKLGANSAYAVDTDETVIETAKNNAVINNESKINFFNASSDILPDEKFDFVFANILHNVLALIMPDLKRIMKNNAFIVLSGILEGKEDIVLNAAAENNLKIIEINKQAEWIAITAKKED